MRLHLPCLLAWMVACAAAEVDDDGTSDPSGSSADDDDDGDATIDPTLTSADDGASTDTSDGTTASTSPTDASSSADSSADDPSDDGSTLTTESSGSTGDGHNDACVAGCMIEFGCQDTCECGTTWKSEEACVAWCEANLEKAALFTEFCRDAWENMSACIGTLDCDGYHEFHNPAVPDYPCVSEADSLAFECKGQ